MEQQTLTVETRTTKGKGAARKIRAAGKVPGVLYGTGKNFDLALDPRAITSALLSETGKTSLFSLKGEGMEGKRALIKDWQVDPLSRKLVHVDLFEIDPKKKLAVTVKLNFTGKAAGVADGGVLNMVARELEVRCFPDKIPAHIDVDVTALKIGDSIHLNEIKFPEGVEPSSHKNDTLVTVVPPTKEEEAAPVLTQAAEPEVLTAKAKEGEEGAAPAAGAKPDAKAEKGGDKEKK
jgi:large subunit ribosomal protein L25